MSKEDEQERERSAIVIIDVGEPSPRLLAEVIVARTRRVRLQKEQVASK